MTRMTPELERLAAARPETARHAAALTDEGERRALLAAIMADEQPQRSRRRHHRWLMPVAAAAASAPAASRRHRHIAFAATAVTVTAGAALTVTALTPAGEQASHHPPVQLAAWTVSRLADGNISVTIRQLKDPAGLQATLRGDGVPASVTFTSQQNPACQPYPGGTPEPAQQATPLLKQVFPVPYQGLARNLLRGAAQTVPFTRRARGSNNLNLRHSAVIVIRPAALPGSAGVQIAVSYAGPAGPESLQSPAVVYASARCTGS